jgi:uncharacterized protein (TIGR02453 family)
LGEFGALWRAERAHPAQGVARYDPAMAFRGFPPAAIQFFEELEADNSKPWWTAHKAQYEECVRGPMEALIATVDERYRPMRIFRPYRDTRFSKDKTPYKTNVAAAGEAEGGTTHYVSLSAEGLFAGRGYYSMASDQLARFRAALDDDATGSECDRLVADAERAGYTIGAHDELKSAPRGFAKDHPRIVLLRRKGLTMWRGWPVAGWLHTAKAKDRVQGLWDAAAPISAWLDTHVGPSELPPDDRDAR